MDIFSHIFCRKKLKSLFERTKMNEEDARDSPFKKHFIFNEVK